jgi:hypothetical protein
MLPEKSRKGKISVNFDPDINIKIVQSPISPFLVQLKVQFNKVSLEEHYLGIFNAILQLYTFK